MKRLLSVLVLLCGASVAQIINPTASSGGSVTTFSVDCTGVTELNCSVATATSTPALTISKANAVAGTLFGNTGTSSAAPVFTATPVLGIAGTTVGTMGFRNATSGTITLSPVTGALGTVTLSLPAATDTLVGLATTDTLTNKTLTSPILTTPNLGTPSAVTLTNATGFPKADVFEASLHCSDNGSTDDYACAMSPAITAYVDGTAYWFWAKTVNTGAATVNFNTVGQKTLVKGISTGLSNGDIPAGSWVMAVYDTAQDRMQIRSILGNPPSGTSPITVSAIGAIGCATCLINTAITPGTDCAAVGTSASPSVASCSAAIAGAFSCATNATGATCTVNTTAVTANSQIFVQEDETNGTRLSVTCNTGTTVIPTSRLLASRSAGVSFTINLGTVTTNPACFDYFIIN